MMSFSSEGSLVFSRRSSLLRSRFLPCLPSRSRGGPAAVAVRALGASAFALPASASVSAGAPGTGSWRTVRVSVSTATGGRLDGLAARSATDAWAVGSACIGDGATGQPLTEHWNGRQWTRVPAPGAAGSPHSSLLGVAVNSASDAWAVGEAIKSGAQSPFIQNWSGHQWRRMPVPNVGPDVALSGVTVAADGQAWAVGTVSVDGGAYRSYAMRWNGRRWAAVGVPDRGPASDDRQFQSVTPPGGGRLAAVGTDQGSAGGSALYGIWNGSAWSVSLGPLSPKSKDLNAVARDGRHAVWAVGPADLSQQAFAPVVEVNR